MSDYESFEPIDSQVDLTSFDDEFERQTRRAMTRSPTANTK